MKCQPFQTIKNAPENVCFGCGKLKTVSQFFTPPSEQIKNISEIF